MNALDRFAARILPTDRADFSRIGLPGVRNHWLWLRVVIRFSLFVGLFGIATAEKLPVKSYTIADGLAMDQVNIIRQDSRGLLWFGTSDGISWFDGYHFTTYMPDDGLPRKEVFDVLETRAGELWFATSDGVCRFHHTPEVGSGKSPQPRFEVFRPSTPLKFSFMVRRIVEAPDGSIWCGAFQGLFRLRMQGRAWGLEAVDVGLRNVLWADLMVMDLLCEPSGVLWIAANGGLYRRETNGKAVRFGRAFGLPARGFKTLAASPGGYVWVGTDAGFFCLRSPLESEPVKLIRSYGEADRLPSSRILSTRFSRDGGLWVGTQGGLVRLELSRGAESPAIQVYTPANGLVDEEITTLEEDREGNLWAGTDHAGVMKISRRGFRNFDLTDGLTGSLVELAFEDRAGHLGFLLGVAGETDKKYFTLFDGKRFSDIGLTAGPKRLAWVGYQGVLQDHEGGWWLATGAEGLWRFPSSESFSGLANRRPSRVYGAREGLAPTVYCVFEDSRHDIWVGIQDGPPHLARWERKTGRFSTFDTVDMPMALAEDRAGNIWIGLLSSGARRYRKGEMTHYTPSQGFPRGGVQHLYLDRRGQLWASSLSGGAVCIPDPDADRPRFNALTTRQGLSSNHVRFVMEDREGGYFIGTLRGLDRWDPQKKTIRHYTTNDGLAGNLQNVGLLDRDGNCWFGTYLGISRLILSETSAAHPVEVFIQGLRLGGIPWPVDSLGQQMVKDVVVPFERNRVAIDFAGVSFSPGDVLHYRYRFGRNESGWSSLSNQHSLDLIDVRPGTHILELQAVNSDGVASPRPAVVEFTVLVPMWRRWWVIAGMILLLGTGLFAVVRLQVRRRLEMERVRTRIATDLHDDIGSSLSQISILCEVAVRHLPADPKSAIESLSQVTETTRTLVDSMSDIVWAINPARDRLDDLIHRMRRFANDLFGDGSVQYHFASNEQRDFPLGNDCRRQIYLVYKECLHNAVRHSQATEVAIDLQLPAGWMELQVRDNGVGFDPAAMENCGNGLRSMRNRAEQLGGSLSIDSRPGEGTLIKFRIPVGASRWRRGCRGSATTS